MGYRCAAKGVEVQSEDRPMQESRIRLLRVTILTIRTAANKQIDV